MNIIPIKSLAKIYTDLYKQDLITVKQIPSTVYPLASEIIMEHDAEQKRLEKMELKKFEGGDAISTS